MLYLQRLTKESIQKFWENLTYTTLTRSFNMKTANLDGNFVDKGQVQ